jgi:hypothetical protein
MEPEFRKRVRLPGPNVREGIERTIAAARAAGAEVCTVLTVPSYPYPIPYALAMAQRRHLGAGMLTITRTEALSEYRAVEGTVRTLAAGGRLRMVDPKDVLCPGSTCLIQANDGRSLYRDSSHLSEQGALLLTDLLQTCAVRPER